VRLLYDRFDQRALSERLATDRTSPYVVTVARRSLVPSSVGARERHNAARGMI
jgi:hypothetical protein